MFHKITEFENKIAEFFGAPYAVATDCCTHAIELCLRLSQCDQILIPTRTYISIPMTAAKVGIDWAWKEENWQDYYKLDGTNIIDAAVYWKQDGYIPGSMMCLSFQFKKHLSIGRGGMILLDHLAQAEVLRCMKYDGRSPDRAWTEQDIKIHGYHYYLTPEMAQTGLDRLPDAILTRPKSWSYLDYPYLPNMSVFADKSAHKKAKK